MIPTRDLCVSIHDGWDGNPAVRINSGASDASSPPCSPAIASGESSLGGKRSAAAVCVSEGDEAIAGCDTTERFGEAVLWPRHLFSSHSTHSTRPSDTGKPQAPHFRSPRNTGGMWLDSASIDGDSAVAGCSAADQKSRLVGDAGSGPGAISGAGAATTGPGSGDASTGNSSGTSAAISRRGCSAESGPSADTSNAATSRTSSSS